MEKTLCSLSILSLLLVSCPEREAPVYHVGQRSERYMDRDRNRPLDVEIWYPTYDTVAEGEWGGTAMFKEVRTVPNANIVDGRFPLLLVSHGTGGNRFSLTWLIEKMVGQGYIVVSLGHYGNTSFNKIPREFVKWWERAIDVQFVLDQVLEDEILEKHIAMDKIGGVGFSLGGYTNIALAGGKVDRTAPWGVDGDTADGLPPEFPDTETTLDLKNDSLIVSSFESYGDKVKDPRIKAFFVMAPAIGFGFRSKEQTKEITAPIFIVAGKGDVNTPIRDNALNYHKLIPSSQLYLLGENVGHYVFLNEATDFGKEMAPEITVDREGVDRGRIHGEVARMAVTFFNRHLKWREQK